MPERPPIRVGILVDSLVQPAWVRRILAEIRASSFAELALVVRNGAYRPEPLPELVRDYRHQLLPLLYDRLDARLVKRRRRPDAFERESVEPLVAGVPLLEVRTIRKRYSDYFPDEDVERILAHGLDVALRFGFRILRGRSLEIARHGVWSYHHGDNLEVRGGPNSFWEVMEARPVTGAVLQVLTPDLDNGRVIYRTYSATHPSSLSLSRNRHYWKAASFVTRKLRDLHEQGPAALEDPLPTGFRAYDRPIYRRPTNLAAVPILARFGARLAGRSAERLLTREAWSVAYRLSPGRADELPAFHRFRPLVPPPGSEWSQPFPARVEGKSFVLVAERQAGHARRRIVALELDSGGPVGQARVALERAVDLSYPFVFEWRGTWYLLPTVGGRADLTLYRCVSFPDRWQPERALLRDVRAAHATLAEHAGAWWLLVALAEEGAPPTDELHVFRAETPLGPWRPHPRNPVRSDVRGARPAGGLFRWGGQLYRPAQDCSLREGYAITINRVDDFSFERYAETEVSKILPRWRKGQIGTGVFNRVGPLSCVDALERAVRAPRRFPAARPGHREGRRIARAEG